MPSRSVPKLRCSDEDKAQEAIWTQARSCRPSTARPLRRALVTRTMDEIREKSVRDFFMDQCFDGAFVKGGNDDTLFLECIYGS